MEYMYEQSRPFNREVLEDVYVALQRIGLHFREFQLLQETNNSIVVTAINSEGEQVAIKMLDVRKVHMEQNQEKKQKLPKWMAREVLYHCYMDHPAVIQFCDTYFASPYLCVEMEYAPGGTLLQYLNRKKSISEDEVRYWFQQLVLAVNYCHRMGIANRDIKLENCLLVPSDNANELSVLKLADFGYAKHTNHEVESYHTSRVGTLPYYSPDVWNLGPGQAYDGRKCDVWSCGICLYVLLAGKYPFDPSLPALELKRKVCNAEFEVPAWKVSVGAYELLKRLLEPDPSTRYNIAQVIKHDWFQCGLSSNKAVQQDQSYREEQSNGRNQLIQHAKYVLNQALPNLVSPQDMSHIGRPHYLYRASPRQHSSSQENRPQDTPIEIDEETFEQVMQEIMGFQQW
eukprot:TRINITY_DN1782_c0_g1_i3.p1 TRINITY_DN1782_c0_g1~~TRINITY_DN1782_c0_g1_i3.p1  ORF type:complete len:400 (+),score=32.18 TRINITY_DN1782_c0_g1_i3:246-1445(+)